MGLQGLRCSGRAWWFCCSSSYRAGPGVFPGAGRRLSGRDCISAFLSVDSLIRTRAAAGCSDCRAGSWGLRIFGLRTPHASKPRRRSAHSSLRPASSPRLVQELVALVQQQLQGKAGKLPRSRQLFLAGAWGLHYQSTQKPHASKPQPRSARPSLHPVSNLSLVRRCRSWWLWCSSSFRARQGSFPGAGRCSWQGLQQVWRPC